MNDHLKNGDHMEERKIYALGFFDGVHLGHQALLSECCRMARKLGAAPCAITFDRHPQALFTADPPKLISRQADRLDLLKQYGIAEVRSYPVTAETMSMPWQAFLGQLTEKGAVGFVCGEDFRFGHRGAGTAEILREYCRKKGLSCTVVPQLLVDGKPVSSTRIRSLLEQGDVENANDLLGHPHVFGGQVVSGRRIGRTIGIPTANISIPDEVVVPKHGVYACVAEVDGESHVAVTNIGSRPTVAGHEVRAESWLLDFSGDLYGKTVKLQFHKFLRPEERFDSLESLRQQIQKDAIQAQEFFDKK